MKFSQEAFMARIEELFKIGGHTKDIAHCTEICSTFHGSKIFCEECPISKENTGTPGTQNIEKYFPILERKLKLKKLLEE